MTAMNLDFRRSRIRKIALDVAVALFLGVAIFSNAAAAERPDATQPPVSVTLSGKLVQISGLTPGGRAALFSISQVSHRYWAETVPQSAIVQAASGSGTAVFTSSIDIPWMSVWAVVDLSSGRSAIVTPREYKAHALAFPADSLKRDKGDGNDRFETGRPNIVAFWVRPGTGAWVVTFGEASPDNEGKGERKTTMRFELMKPIGDSPASPKKIKKKDFFMAIDPSTMEFYSTEISD